MSRTITIKEKAEITKQPDFIIIRLVIEGTAKKYADAVQQAKEKIHQLISAMEDIELEKDCAKTSEYNVRPNYSFSQGKKGKIESSLEGYTCIHELKIEFYFESEMLQKVLDAIPVCLANPQLYISFTLKNKDTLHVELMKNIAENAKRKAETLCVTAGAELGKLLTVEYHNNGIDSILSTPFITDETCEMVIEQPTRNTLQAEVQPNDVIVRDSATFVWEIR